MGGGYKSDGSDMVFDFVSDYSFFKGEKMQMDQSSANKAVKRAFEEIKNVDSESENFELNTMWVVGVVIHVLGAISKSQNLTS